MAPNLKGKVCVVTGASKGIGRGIALQLGSAGAKVYITGRSQVPLQTCANEINARGGIGVGIILDHSNDKEVERFFRKLDQDENGKLDILVNNAFSAVNSIMTSMGKPFWTLDPVEQWDSINNVGLRGHYLCSTFASRIMVPRKSGLIVNISSFGGWSYLLNVPYAIGKTGVDRMATDSAEELKKENVTMVSIWPGPVKTEFFKKNLGKSESVINGETPEFVGIAIAHLAADPKKIEKTGRILITSKLAKEYGFTDIDGRLPTADNMQAKPSWFHQAFNKTS